MNRVLTERRAVLCFTAVLVIYCGALSPAWLAGHISPRLGGLARGAIATLGLGILGLELVLSGRIRFPALVALGLLPWLYVVGAKFTRSDLEGAYVYLYKYAPYLCGGALWLLLRRISDRAFLWTVLGLTAFISLRVLVVFVLPGSGPQRHDLSEAADAFYVYEWVGSFPRVFYPGPAVIFLGLLLALRGCVQSKGREQLACVAVLSLGAAALLASMTRGLILIAALVFAVQLLWILADSRVNFLRKLNLLTVVVLLIGAAAVALFASGYGQGLLKSLGSSDRVTLDDRNMRWRRDQADAAFSMMKNTQDWVLGVGPTATVPLTRGTINELHFGYHSMLWTFGLIGLSLLMVVLLQALAGGVIGPRGRPYWREMWLTLIFVAANGAYTPVFSSADWAIVLVLASAYVWEPGRSADSVPGRRKRHPPSVPSPAAPQAAPARPRRWSDGVRGNHAVP